MIKEKTYTILMLFNFLSFSSFAAAETPHTAQEATATKKNSRTAQDIRTSDGKMASTGSKAPSSRSKPVPARSIPAPAVSQMHSKPMKLTSSLPLPAWYTQPNLPVSFTPEKFASASSNRMTVGYITGYKKNGALGPEKAITAVNASQARQQLVTAAFAALYPSLSQELSSSEWLTVDKQVSARCTLQKAARYQELVNRVFVNHMIKKGLDAKAGGLDRKKVSFRIVPLAKGREGQLHAEQLKAMKGDPKKIDTFLKPARDVADDPQKKISCTLWELKQMRDAAEKSTDSKGSSGFVSNLVAAVEQGMQDFLKAQQTYGFQTVTFAPQDSKEGTSDTFAIYIESVETLPFADFPFGLKIAVIEKEPEMKKLFDGIKIYWEQDPQITQSPLKSVPFMERFVVSPVTPAPEILIAGSYAGCKKDKKYQITRADAHLLCHEVFGKILNDMEKDLPDDAKRADQRANALSMLSVSMATNFFWKMLYKAMKVQGMVSPELRKEAQDMQKETRQKFRASATSNYLKKTVPDIASAPTPPYLDCAQICYTFTVIENMSQATSQDLKNFMSGSATAGRVAQFETKVKSFLSAAALERWNKPWNREPYADFLNTMERISQQFTENKMAFEEALTRRETNGIGFALRFSRQDNKDYAFLYYVRDITASDRIGDVALMDYLFTYPQVQAFSRKYLHSLVLNPAVVTSNPVLKPFTPVTETTAVVTPKLAASVVAKS